MDKNGWILILVQSINSIEIVALDSCLRYKQLWSFGTMQTPRARGWGRKSAPFGVITYLICSRKVNYQSFWKRSRQQTKSTLRPFCLKNGLEDIWAIWPKNARAPLRGKGNSLMCESVMKNEHTQTHKRYKLKKKSLFVVVVNIPCLPPSIKQSLPDIDK